MLYLKIGFSAGNESKILKHNNPLVSKAALLNTRGFFIYLFILPTMIYKFENHSIPSVMEVELCHPKQNSEHADGIITFSIQEDESLWVTIELSKSDVFKLIGALHLLHKEMV